MMNTGVVSLLGGVHQDTFMTFPVDSLVVP